MLRSRLVPKPSPYRGTVEYANIQPQLSPSNSLRVEPPIPWKKGRDSQYAYQPLGWYWSKIPQVVRLSVIGDNSCYYHSVYKSIGKLSNLPSTSPFRSSEQFISTIDYMDVDYRDPTSLRRYVESQSGVDTEYLRDTYGHRQYLVDKWRNDLMRWFTYTADDGLTEEMARSIILTDPRTLKVWLPERIRNPNTYHFVSTNSELVDIIKYVLDSGFDRSITYLEQLNNVSLALTQSSSSIQEAIDNTKLTYNEAYMIVVHIEKSKSTLREMESIISTWSPPSNREDIHKRLKEGDVQFIVNSVNEVKPNLTDEEYGILYYLLAHHTPITDDILNDPFHPLQMVIEQELSKSGASKPLLDTIHDYFRDDTKKEYQVRDFLQFKYTGAQLDILKDYIRIYYGLINYLKSRVATSMNNYTHGNYSSAFLESELSDAISAWNLVFGSINPMTNRKYSVEEVENLKSLDPRTVTVQGIPLATLYVNGSATTEVDPVMMSIPLNSNYYMSDNGFHLRARLEESNIRTIQKMLPVNNGVRRDAGEDILPWMSRLLSLNVHVLRAYNGFVWLYRDYTSGDLNTVLENTPHIFINNTGNHYDVIGYIPMSKQDRSDEDDSKDSSPVYRQYYPSSVNQLDIQTLFNSNDELVRDVNLFPTYTTVEGRAVTVEQFYEHVKNHVVEIPPGPTVLINNYLPSLLGRPTIPLLPPLGGFPTLPSIPGLPLLATLPILPPIPPLTSIPIIPLSVFKPSSSGSSTIPAPIVPLIPSERGRIGVLPVLPPLVPSLPSAFLPSRMSLRDFNVSQGLAADSVEAVDIYNAVINDGGNDSFINESDGWDQDFE